MDIHNLMEELVIDTVEEIFSDPDYIKQAGCCDSDHCRTDVVCYVLNRIPPIYATSSRGLAHIGKTVIDKPQIIADIAALVNEGIKQVGAHNRNDSPEPDYEIPEPPLYNFPIIKGKVIDGKTFAPITGTSISLKMDGVLVPMHASRWSNPSPLVEETEGDFLFWPRSVKAGSAAEKKSFSLQLELAAEGYKPVKHFVNLELDAEDQFVSSTEVNRIFKVEPIYLFDKNEPEEIIPK
ncbi:MAG: late competence development ComFB family protein [Spirochaetales bacterium]|uniref:Late competence development ComFB family protein n=1 Tax=Candidatus Thalassospirochaeta sargassi TaxID=3119039 RepID=A0AAJ1ICE2_9SPIO|nr:late competence development ComFB family protein [Spirochaetales bacterium]